MMRSFGMARPMQALVPFLLGAAMLSASPAIAQEALPAMTTGPVFDFGPAAEIESDMPIPEGAEFRVAFDEHEAGKDGEVNSRFTTLARFFNMHAKAGVPPENIHLAVVMHGPAGVDLLNDEAYGKRHDGAANPNKAIIAELLKHDVQIIICGQSATFMGITKDQLLPGVKMALSAMTAHALLQQQGYTLNPF